MFSLFCVQTFSRSLLSLSLARFLCLHKFGLLIVLFSVSVSVLLYTVFVWIKVIIIIIIIKKLLAHTVTPVLLVRLLSENIMQILPHKPVYFLCY